VAHCVAGLDVGGLYSSPKREIARCMVKTKVVPVLALLLFAGLFPLLGCSSAGNTVEVSCGDFTNQKDVSREINVSCGKTIQVNLCANPTTGFEWEEAEISDTGVLGQSSRKFIGPDSVPPPPPGSPGQEVWTFEALGKGSSTVTIRYSRPWEGGEKGVWTFTLDVKVG